MNFYKSKFKIILTAVKHYKAYRAFSRLKNDTEKENSPIPKQLVEEIVKMGSTYIKLGQILSTRPDLLPRQYIDALEKLQENVPPFSFQQVEKMVKKELRLSTKDLFLTFDKTPVASASLSQVHFAKLKSGEEVAVKIQRPGLLNEVSQDLNKIGQLLSFVKYLNRKAFANLNLDNVFREFKRYTLQELDFLVEGNTYERFRKNFKGNSKIVFPKIFWDYSTPLILTMEKLSGMRLHEVRNKMSIEDRRVLADNTIKALIDMFVRDGFFHADLHPGNIFFREDGTLAIIDVGMFGELTNEQRERFILYWLAIVMKQKHRAFNHLLKLTNKSPVANEKVFYQQYSRILEEFYNSTIKEKSLTKTYLEILIAGSKYGFVFPAEMLLQAKALTTAEHIGYELVPGFNFAETAKPIVTNLLASRLSLPKIMRRLCSTYPEWFLLGEPARSELLDNLQQEDHMWESVGEEIAKKWDGFHEGDFQEVRHGEYSVEINLEISDVFNFVTRFAKYPLWHPIYTMDSHVIHVSGEYIFLTPEVIGSVFRLDEIVDGYHLLSNGVITHFERNKMLKWKAPFSMLPLIELGTCIEFEPLKNGKTRLHEYFFFSESPLKHVFVNRKWFSKKALTSHIKEELMGIKKILESGNYTSKDVAYLWEINKPIRFSNSVSYVIDNWETNFSGANSIHQSNIMQQ